MALIIRTFRSRQGRDAEVVEGLRSLASGMVRHVQAGSVVICRQTNDPEQLLWIGDRGNELDFRALPLWKKLIESLEDSVVASSPPLSLVFLDEFYRFPPPPYQVWSLEVRASQDEQIGIMTDLFDLSRLARRDRHVVGMSLYRAVGEPGTFIGFLGVAWGFTPHRLVRNGEGGSRMTERIERALVWRPLSVVYQVGRLPGDRITGGDAAPSHASVIPFWVRSGESPRSSLGLSESGGQASRAPTREKGTVTSGASPTRQETRSSLGTKPW